MHKFLSKIFALEKATKMRIEMHNFAQYKGGTFYEAWDHYEDPQKMPPPLIGKMNASATFLQWFNQDY